MGNVTLLEVKALKEQVTTLKESVKLVEVNLEIEERPVDNRDNDDSESLNTCITAGLAGCPLSKQKMAPKGTCRTSRLNLT